MLYVFAMIVFIVVKRKQRKDRRLREQFLQLPVPEGLGFKSSRLLGLDEQYLTDLAQYRACGVRQGGVEGAWGLVKWRQGRRSVKLKQVNTKDYKILGYEETTCSQGFTCSIYCTLER